MAEVAQDSGNRVEDIESQIKAAILSRSSYFQDQADSLTFEGVRRLLEKDLGFETHSLDSHKRFVKRWLQNCIESAVDDKMTKREGTVVSSTEGESVNQPEAKKENLNSEGEEIMEDSPVMGLLTGPKKVEANANGAEEQKIEAVPSEPRIKKAIWERAPYLKENSQSVTLAGLRRLLEEDLGFEKHALDPFKKFISQQVDEVLNSPESPSKTVIDKKKTGKKDSNKKVASKSSKEEAPTTSGDESDDVSEKEVKVRKKPAVAAKLQKSAAVKKRKRPEVDSKGTKRKQIKASNSLSEESGNEDGGDVSEDNNSESSVEKPVKKKEVPKSSYGKQVEHLRSVIKSCGMSVPPVVYKKVKQAPENKRESYLIKELEEILSKEGLSTNPSEKGAKKEWCFTCELERLVLKANEVGYPQSPIGILSQIKKIGSHLTNGREEDAHEFLRYAVETMQSICLKEAEVKTSGPLGEETTLVGLTFGGYLRSKIKCTRCHAKSERQERMMDLTVEIEGDVETLEDALRRFTGTESLDGENKYNCGSCRSYEKAKKKLSILEAPNVLTIALKRFQSGKFGKLNKSIRFPEILNLAPYMRGGSDKSPIYRLYGVVVHLDTMNASFSGHYVCCVRNAHNKWFKIDDSTVSPVELEQALNKGAYMLFYSRCLPRAPRSIRSTIVSRDLPTKIKNPAINPTRSNNRISTSRQRDSSAHANHIRNDLGNLGYVLQDVTRLPSLHNLYGVDSSSDNSSDFSRSDEVSTSTDTTRDSISADDISEYIFGYNAFSRSSDLDTSSSSSSSSSSPLYTTYLPRFNSERYSSALSEQNVVESDSVGGVTFLHSNSSQQVRNLVNISSSNSETDANRSGQANPLHNSKSGVHLRKLARNKAD